MCEPQHFYSGLHIYGSFFQIKLSYGCLMSTLSSQIFSWNNGKMFEVLQSTIGFFRRSCKHILCLRTDEAICRSPFGQTLCRWCSFSQWQSQCFLVSSYATVSSFLLESTFHSMTQLLGFFGESLLGHHSRSLNMRVSLPKWSNFWQLDQLGILRVNWPPKK